MGRKRGSRNAPIAAKAEAPAEISADARKVDGGEQQPPVAALDDAGKTQGAPSESTAEATDPVHGLRRPGIGTDSGTGENVAAEVPAGAEGLTDGQEEGQDVQGAETTAAPGSGDPDGSPATPAAADDHGGDADGNGGGDSAGTASGDQGASEPVDGSDEGSAIDDLSDLSRFADDNVLAAFCTSQLTLNASRDGFSSANRIMEHAAEGNVAADFIRTNPEAPVEATAIHVHMSRTLGRHAGPGLTHRERAAWTVFRATLVALDEAGKARAAEEAAAQAKPAPSGGWPGEQALQPSKPAFSPSGFSPR